MTETEMEMGTWTIGRRIVVGFSVVIGIAVLLGTFAYACLITIAAESTSIATDTMPGLALSTQIRGETHIQLELTLMHIVATEATGRGQIEAQIREADDRLQKTMAAYAETDASAGEREALGRFKEGLGRVRQIRDTVLVPLDRAEKTAEAEAVVKTQFRPAIDECMKSVGTLVDLNKSGNEAATDTIRREIASAKTGVVIGLILALLVSAGIAFVIVRGTSRVLAVSVDELTAGAGQVASAAEQLSGSSQSLSQGASSQAAALEETSASMEEMSSMTRQNAEHSQQGAQLMSEVDRRVSESKQLLTAMITSMRNIQDSSSKVSKIIRTVDEIAFQTNILALNAAVEAARAGEAGMGFAVVADEVRNLAQRALQAAKDTSALIEEAISNAQEGDQRVREVAEAITAITGSVSEAKRLVDEVSAASKQQTQGIDQVSKAITELEQLTQRTAANSEESAAASEELSSQAEVTMSVVTRLNALVGSRTTGGSAVGYAAELAPPPQRSARVVPMNRQNAA